MIDGGNSVGKRKNIKEYKNIESNMLHEWKTAWRNLLKYKVQNLIAVAGLAVGLLSFSICMYSSRYVENIDVCFRNRDRLAELRLTGPNGLIAGTPAELSQTLRKYDWPEVETVCCLSYLRTREYDVVTEAGKRLPYSLNTIETDTAYFRVFTPDIRQGSWAAAAQGVNSVVLTESSARRIFGPDGNPVGQTLILARRLFSSPSGTPREGGIVYTVRAVMEDFPQNTSISFTMPVDMLTVNDTEGLIGNPAGTGRTGTLTYALLAPGKKASDFQHRLEVQDFTFEVFGDAGTVLAAPIGQFYKKRASVHTVAFLVGLVGALILLSGLLNFFHFQIGSFLNRMREYSVRRVLGGGAPALFRLLFFQLLLVLAGTVMLLFCLVEVLAPYLHFHLPSVIRMQVDPHLLATHMLQYLVVLVALCAVICAVTVFRVLRISVQDGIRGGGQRPGKRRMRAVMLGIQFFICWLFVVFTLGFYLQSEKTTDMLFQTLSKSEKRTIFSIPLSYPFLKEAEKQTLTDRFRQFSGVRDVLVSDIGYLEGWSGDGLYTEPGNSSTYFETNLLTVVPNFFSFMNLPLLRGTCMESDGQVMVDRIFTEKHPGEILGKQFYTSGGRGLTVCGVSESICLNVRAASTGYLFYPVQVSGYIGHCYVKSEPGRESEVKEWLTGAMKEVLPENVVPEIDTLLENIRGRQPFENKLKGIILFFSVVSLIVALLGVYSAVTLDTERRQKEVAVRKINGASFRKIVFLFARSYLVLLVVTAMLAFPLAGAGFAWWKQMYTVFFNYGAFFWSSVFALVAAVTFLTVIFRIVRVARLNPAEVIKNE